MYAYILALRKFKVNRLSFNLSVIGRTQPEAISIAPGSSLARASLRPQRRFLYLFSGQQPGLFKRKDRSKIYALLSRDASVVGMLDSTHLGHHVGKGDDIRVCIASGEDQVKFLRFVPDKINDIF